MMGSDLAYGTIAGLSEKIRTKELSPVELVTELLDRIGRYNDRLRHYITVCEESALEAARGAENRISKGEHQGVLHGIPISHKDIVLTAGVRTTAHSRLLVDFIPTQDATCVRRLADAGMILLGKTNTNEWACGSLEVFGPSSNPWDESRYAGGSSGGSAGAVAAGLAIAATGSDTGGSIRVPSSFSGTVGLKPTFGRVSRHGLIPLSWTTDQVGPMTRTVEDCALIFEVMAGHDPQDIKTAQVPVPTFDGMGDQELKGLVVGVPENYFYDRLDPDVEITVKAALLELEALGCRLEPVTFKLVDAELPAISWLIAMVEAYGQHAARMKSHGHLYSERARRRLGAGAFYSAADYQKACQIRELWIRELRDVMQRVDVLATPTLPYPAITLEEQETGPPDLTWGTFPFSLSGSPAMSIPCGFTPKGLPVGLQLVASPFDEATLFRVGHGFQQSTDWHLRRPRLEGV